LAPLAQWGVGAKYFLSPRGHSPLRPCLSGRVDAAFAFIEPVILHFPVERRAANTQLAGHFRHLAAIMAQREADRLFLQPLQPTHVAILVEQPQDIGVAHLNPHDLALEVARADRRRRRGHPHVETRDMGRDLGKFRDRQFVAIGERHRITEEGGWRIMTPRHAPHATLEGHLTFALKYEGLDLAVLKRLFLAAGSGAIETLVREKSTGAYARRIWFLYEWLTGRRLDLQNANTGRYVPVVDPEQQYVAKGENAPRYRVRNNLPGTPAFCPLVFRTEALEQFISLNLPDRARETVAAVPRDLLARTAAFLLLKDSRASYAIEGERPPQDRIQRWGRAIGEAGRQVLDRDELLRLQKIVMGDGRFIKLGFRGDSGFVGEHDRETRMPLPDHIDARPEDLPSLIDGMIAFDRGHAQALDAVIAAAALAFGFVYAHPFEDGNGRIHRYLIHHVLAERGFNPPGVVFPVSAAILDRIDDYRQVLESH